MISSTLVICEKANPLWPSSCNLYRSLSNRIICPDEDQHQLTQTSRLEILAGVVADLAEFQHEIVKTGRGAHGIEQERTVVIHDGAIEC
jgi:hypothetical protein